MKILISNDDGIDAEGIHVLVEALQPLGKIFVVAPDRNRSGASNSLTLSNPVRVQHRRNGWISVQGTPTDCVHLALTGLLAEKPDIVVSGINAGGNLSDDVWYSGTVAAAMEGRFVGLPSLAVSLTGDHHHYATAGAVARQLVEWIAKNPLPPATILNVNVPDVPLEQIRGFEITRLGNRHQGEPVVPQKDPRGLPIYWVGPAGPAADSGEGTDFWAVQANKVSLTPLKIDITDYEAFEHLSKWVRLVGG